jgi:hypothetical protein
MKAISPAHYGLSICVASAMLAGCGGSAQSPNPTAQAPLVRARSNSSGNEVLDSRIVLNCVSFYFQICHFHTRHLGHATGPYPGIFTVKGRWSSSLRYGMSPISESFTIVSGTSKITGSLSYSSASGYGYTSSIGNGKAKIRVGERRLREVLYGL